MNDRPLKIVYCTPALYLAGGVERVLTLKANYFAEHFGYDITIILTDGKGKPFAYPLSDKIKVVHLDINFEELWTCSFLKKIFVYLKKQRIFKRRLTEELMRIRPDITVSLLRREINFINGIKDGSKKIGELHVNRANYRNFEANDTNVIKRIFERFWMKNLVSHLKRLDRFVVLTHEDGASWSDLPKVEVIPDPLSFSPQVQSSLSSKRIIAAGRYVYQKGFDLLLHAWASVEKRCPDWELVIFGAGDRTPYERLSSELLLQRCSLNGPTADIEKEYLNSSLFAFSSRFEGFGMVLIEAMACGLPVVSFACPCGPKDIITDGIDGILVENGKVSQLAEKIIYMIEHPEERTRMGANAVRKSERYKIDRLAKDWQQLFESL
jgi:glycosyltransferase involved in cell wall biosynthesis